MYAVVEYGGKQYRLEDGQEIALERVNAAVGSSVDMAKIGRVILVSDGGKVIYETKELAKSPVTATVLEHLQDRKVIVFKYLSKKGLRRKQGHRQQLTRVRVSLAASAPEGAPEKEKAASVPSAAKKTAAKPKAAATQKSQKGGSGKAEASKKAVAPRAAAKTGGAAKKKTSSAKKISGAAEKKKASKE